jgi:hypothetical protein
MEGVATGAASPRPSQIDGAAYGVVVLRELFQPATSKTSLYLPLTFAYLLSPYLPFVLPVGCDCAAVESVWDEILAGNSLRSKGISYQRGLDKESVNRFVERAQLVVTTDLEVQRQAEQRKLPNVFVQQGDGRAPHVKLGSVENISPELLKGQVVGCAQLINIQSGGFISEGHFSLSW